MMKKDAKGDSKDAVKDMIKPARNLDELEGFEIKAEPVEFELPPLSLQPTQQQRPPPPLPPAQPPQPQTQQPSPPPQQQRNPTPSQSEVDAYAAAIERMHPLERAALGYKLYSYDAIINNIKAQDVLEYLQRFNVPAVVLEILKVWLERTCGKK